jgi:CubicO group peptidase (beta-lactamase class C family)
MEKQICSLFEDYYKECRFSGAGLVRRGDTVLFSGAYGYAHRGFQIPNTVGTMFDTASVTKLFTAVAILQLVNRGLLRLDDKITDIIDLKDTRIPGDVTLRHLLTHTSGIADDADEEAGEAYEDLFIDKPNYSLRRCGDYIPQFAYKEPLFKAGTDVRYNNCAFILLGLAAEKVTNRPYQDYVRKEIFEKCGMSHSAFSAKDDGDATIAEGYFVSGTDQRDRPIWRKNIYSYPPVGAADGGAYTSVGDLDIFIRALKNGELLSKEMSEEMFKPQAGIERGFEWGKIVNGFGCHFFYDTGDNLIRIYKEGQSAGVAAMAAYYPGIDTTSIILANQTCNVWELHRKVEQVLFQGI